MTWEGMGYDVGGYGNDGASNLLRPGRNLCRKSKRNLQGEIPAYGDLCITSSRVCKWKPECTK